MPKQFYMPTTDAGRKDWLDHLDDTLQSVAKGYATKYGLSAANVTALHTGRQWVDAVLPYLTGLRDSSQTFTAFKNALFNGTGAIAAPLAPVFTAPAAAPLTGVFLLAAALVQQIKNHPAYTEADGQDMGIEGAAIVPPPAGGVAPDLSKSRIGSGGLVEIVWKKDRYTAIKIMVDRGDGHGEVFLAIDTQPNYTDTVKPAAGASAIYTYRAIYLTGDAEFGQWSQPFEITVRG